MSARVLVGLLIIAAATAHSQIVVSSADMPQNNVSYIWSVSAPRPDLDFAATGTNHTWNFSSLAPAAQAVDTFKSAQGAPSFLPLFYATANSMLRFRPDDLPGALDTMLPDMSLTVYRFFSNTAARYAMLGYGVATDSIAFPLKFTAPDVLYKFPMSFGNTDSTTTGTSFPPFGIDVGLGYSFTMVQTRVNKVDGWGKLTTPFGTFNVLRQKSIVNQAVTVISDSADTQRIDVPTQTEYLWLAQGKGIPVLRVLASGENGGVVVGITYQDSARVVSVRRGLYQVAKAFDQNGHNMTILDLSGRNCGKNTSALPGAGQFLLKNGTRATRVRLLNLP